MERTNISNLKAHLSAYLRKVRAGESVLVLDRGQPIARIERIERTAESDDERLARLEAAGIIRRGKRSLPESFFTRKLPKGGKSVLQALLDERNEGDR